MSSSLPPGIPQRIILVRHGERLDHVDRNWAPNACRPHDAPLTEDGKEMAAILGQHLGRTSLTTAMSNVGRIEDASKSENFAEVLNQVVVMSSPLQRCVETAHYLVEGLASVLQGYQQEEDKDEGTGYKEKENGFRIPVYVEETLLEDPFWMQYDLNNAKRQRGERRAGKTQESDGDEDHASEKIGACSNHPVFFHRSHHAEHTSPLVHPERFSEKFGAVDVYRCPEEKELNEVLGMGRRCWDAAASVPAIPELAGKIVIGVGHGGSVREWYNGIAAKTIVDHPHYTGFAELFPIVTPSSNGSASCDGIGETSVEWRPLLTKPFACPHMGWNDGIFFEQAWWNTPASCYPSVSQVLVDAKTGKPFAKQTGK